MPNKLFIYARIGREGFRCFNGALSISACPIHPDIELAPGYYELEEILNPHREEIPWYVIKGSKIGCSVHYWPALIRQRTPLKVELNQAPTINATT